MKKYETNESRKLFELSKKSLVGGVASALHKADWQEYPIYIAEGKGSKLVDVDGNEYIDYVGAFGPMILGYANDEYNEELIKQLKLGTHYAAPTDSIIQLSDELVNIIPSAEMVSYQCTGTEANMHAFRLARSYTGKNKILKFEGHYHGWSDEEKVSCSADTLSSMGPRNAPWKLKGAFGQREPEDIILAPYNDIGYLEKMFSEKDHEIAAVILETIMCNAEPVFPKPNFLKELRRLTEKHKIVLIFDEVITGFRLGLGSAQGRYGVTPDLSTFGKAIGGGIPIAVVVGKESIMSTSTTPVGTFNGNPLSVAACLTTLRILKRKNIYQDLEKMSAALSDGITALGKKHKIKLLSKSVGSIWTLQFGIDEPLVDYRDHFDKIDKVTYKTVYEKCLSYGIRLHPTRGRFYISIAHTYEDVEKTLSIIDTVFSEL